MASPPLALSTRFPHLVPTSRAKEGHFLDSLHLTPHPRSQAPPLAASGRPSLRHGAYRLPQHQGLRSASTGRKSSVAICPLPSTPLPPTQVPITAASILYSFHRADGQQVWPTHGRLRTLSPSSPGGPGGPEGPGSPWEAKQGQR